MRRKTNPNNQISLDDFPKSISRSFIISLSANSLLDEVRYASEEIASNTFLENSFRQLKWISGQLDELEEYLSDIFDIYPDHPYRLRIVSLFREIPQHIEKTQSALVGMRLSSISDLNIDPDNTRLDVHLYNLNGTLTNLYSSLKNLKIQNN